MESIDIARTKASFYNWLILAVFIGSTMIFMVRFYQKTVDEIVKNTSFVNTQIINSELDYVEEY